jgi:hypothetical protein
MSLRNELRSLKSRAKARIKAVFQTRDATQPSASLPNATAANSFLTPAAGPPVAEHSNQNLPIADPASTPLNSLSTTPDPRNDSSGVNIPTQPPARFPSPISTPVAVPIQSSATNNWTNLKSFLKVLDRAAGAFGPLKAVVGELVECITVYEVRQLVSASYLIALLTRYQRVAKGREEYEALRNDLEGLFEELQQHFPKISPPEMTTSMESLCK